MYMRVYEDVLAKWSHGVLPLLLLLLPELQPNPGQNARLWTNDEQGWVQSMVHSTCLGIQCC